MPAKTLEVRCCCEPEKLLGWITIDTKLAMDGFGFKVARVNRPLVVGTPASEQIRRVEDGVVLTVGLLSTDDEPPYLAVKSNHHPVEVLRELAGFRPRGEE